MVEDLRKVPSRHGLLRETRRTTADGREPGVFSLQLPSRPFPGLLERSPLHRTASFAFHTEGGLPKILRLRPTDGKKYDINTTEIL